MLQAELRVASGKQSGHVIPLVNSRFLIGREEDCHLRPNSDLVSRHHCVFKVDEYSLRVRDLGSTNGTFVNGERLRGEVMLNTGDRVTIGKLEFEVAVGEAVSQPAAVPSASAETDPTDSFELGDTPSPSATMQMPAHDASRVDETIPQDPPAVESQTLAQETVAFQGDTIAGGHTPPPPPMQPPGYAQQPIGYSMPYPQQPQFPYAQPYGMPMMGYPQQPVAYPQMGMYPQQNVPQPVAPPQMPAQAPEAADPAPAPPATGDAPDVRLPDPADTGAKPPEPKPEGNGQAKSDADTTRDTAAEIIKQYTQRRPQT